MAEWSNAAVLKTVILLRVSGVQIPLAPICLGLWLSWIRASPCGGEGRTFESCQSHYPAKVFSSFSQYSSLFFLFSIEVFMTVKELKESLYGQYADCEVYRFRDDEHVVHAEYVIAVNEVADDDEVCSYRLMNEAEYNKTIYANSSYTADFEDYFEDKNAKVLIIVLSEFKR